MAKVIQLPVHEEVIPTNDLYTVGIFWNESYYGREKCPDSTELTATIQKTGVPGVLQVGVP